MVASYYNSISSSKKGARKRPKEPLLKENFLEPNINLVHKILAPRYCRLGLIFYLHCLTLLYQRLPRRRSNPITHPTNWVLPQPSPFKKSTTREDNASTLHLSIKDAVFEEDASSDKSFKDVRKQGVFHWKIYKLFAVCCHKFRSRHLRPEVLLTVKFLPINKKWINSTQFSR